VEICHNSYQQRTASFQRNGKQQQKASDSNAGKHKGRKESDGDQKSHQEQLFL
jgi:hypothetical protein